MGGREGKGLWIQVKTKGCTMPPLDENGKPELAQSMEEKSSWRFSFLSESNLT